MIKSKSIIAAFCLMLVPQQNTVVKHRGSALAFVQSSFTPLTGAGSITSLDTSGHPITVTAGDLLYVVCSASQGGSPTVWTPTSSPANSFSAQGLFGTGSATLSNINGYVAFTAAGGSTVFTCSGSSGNFASIIVLEYHPGFLTAIDTQTSMSGSSAGNSVSTPAFTTTAKGLIIACFVNDVTSGSRTWTAGSIGSGSATLRQTDNGDVSTGRVACEDSITSGSQSGIAGTGSYSGAVANWLAIAGALK